MKEEYKTKWVVVPMPLNAAGNGPETRPEHVVRVRWLVWTWDCITVAECADEEVAQHIADLHNREGGW